MREGIIKILVVEDEPKSVKLIREIIEMRAHTIMEANNGVSALRLINEHIPDLIFVDINLPGMDGLTLTKLIKANPKINNIPVVAVTASAMKGDKQRFLQAGCDEYISKPFHVKDIIDILNKYDVDAKKAQGQHNPIVLVADDRIENLKLIEAILLPLGYNIITVNNGKQAIDKIKTIEPDIALINVLMPEVDGIEVCRLIKADKQTSTIPVIIITALDDTESKIMALSAGADEFLTKPIDRSELILRIKNLLKIKQHVDSLNKIINEKTRSLQSTIETLKQSQIETIYKLSKAVEYMDQNIGNHNERVSRYVMIITNALGISRDEAETISVASCMHDIGKIGVPQSILLKPDSLTTNEFKQVKEHTTIGANILSSAGSKILDLAAEIALTHHERWDGNGYPRGLAGNLIPITGRITAIADVFDALTMKKTYRPAFSVENAIEAINAESGKHLDPELVDVFLNRIKDIIEVTYLFKD